MGNKHISLKMPTGYNNDLIREKVERYLKTKDFSYSIENKSLDARNKNNIYWEMRLLVSSDAISESLPDIQPELYIPYKKERKVLLLLAADQQDFLLHSPFKKPALVQQ